MATYDTEDDAPLDPAAERLRRKLVRLLLVSGGIMLLGLIAVFSAIVYKLSERGVRAASRLSAESPAAGRIAIPPGYQLRGTALDGDRALLTIAAADGATSLVVVDLATGETLSRFTVEPER
jgi:hypothetical protein